MGARAFDPVALASAEADAWVAYYQRDWSTLLRSSVSMVRLGFGMSWGRTLYGAALSSTAIRAWAPYPANDPHRARMLMRRFYALVVRDGGLTLDPAKAARLELEWWRVHRVHQRESGLTEVDLVESLVALYAYTYQAAPDDVRPAAWHRAVAMRHSDAWVRAGARLEDPLLVDVRTELVSCYRALAAAVG